MLTYPGDIQEKLGIDQILEMVRQKCKSEKGVAYLLKVEPSSNLQEVELRLDQTQEMARILASGEAVPSRDFRDLDTFLKKVRVAGSFLQAEDFATLKGLLQLLYQWTQYLKRGKEQSPELCKLTYGFIADTELIKAIDQIVDERGGVRDQASPELAAIRSLLIQKERAVRVAINRVLKKAIHDNLTEEDSSVTIRDGRLVIPIRAEHKRRVQGFIHDESATGQTVFMEPTEALQLNNEVRELQYQELREVARILTRLTDLVRQSIEDLEKGAVFIGLLDFIHAKAVFSMEIEAVRPMLNKQPAMKWYNARHPLLWLSHIASKKSIVPLNLELSRQDHRMLLISGPNAGGKSVALKTVGMLQYMLQCGFLVPVDEHSVFGLFGSIFLDIGDTQSLENDLSTYSSHLTAMNYIHQRADRNSLILIDEFGTGTEPQFGGAIAEALLNQFNSSKSFGVFTTHYQNLKKFAEHQQGIVNGAMKYDVGALEPLFELEVGKPGSSFAFEIARKIGLPGQVIQEAKSLVGTSQVDYEQLLTQLEQEKGKYTQLSKKLEKETLEVVSLRDDYQSLRDMLKEEEKRVIREAKATARQIIDDANQRIESTIRQIKEEKAEKQKTRELRSKLQEYRDGQGQEKEIKPKRTSPSFETGDAVTIVGQDTLGEVVSIKGKQALVRFGNITSFIDPKKLLKVDRAKERTSETRSRRVGGIDFTEKMSRFNGEVDVRGMRAGEALLKVEEYIDQALLLGTDQVRVIHGIGHGILRETIRTHLKGHSSIQKLADEDAESGGSAITLVTFKG